MKYLIWNKLFKTINRLSIRLLTVPLHETVYTEGDQKVLPPPNPCLSGSWSLSNKDSDESFDPFLLCIRDADEEAAPWRKSWMSALD